MNPIELFFMSIWASIIFFILGGLALAGVALFGKRRSTWIPKN